MKRVIVIVSLLCAMCSLADASKGDSRVKIKAARQKIAVNEPLTLEVECTLGDSKSEETQFVLEIDGKPIHDRNILFPAKFHEHQLTDDNVLIFMIEVFYDPFSKKCIFDTPGKYKLVVKETVSGAESSPVVVHVYDAEDKRNKKARHLFAGSEDHFATLLTDRKHGKAGEDLEKLCKDYPETVYAAHASCALGLKKFEAIKRDVSKRKNREEYRQAARYFKASMGKCPGSLLEERALFNLAWCEALAGDYRECKKHLRLLNQQFPHGNYKRKADSMLQELADHGE